LLTCARAEEEEEQEEESSTMLQPLEGILYQQLPGWLYNSWGLRWLILKENNILYTYYSKDDFESGKVVFFLLLLLSFCAKDR
jgi:hypothetical protein